MAHDIFICNSSKDNEIANDICNFLESNNYKCCIDPRDIRHSKNKSDVITYEIINSRMTLYINSINSQECDFIFDEITEAFSHNKPILVVYIDETGLNSKLEFYLKNQRGFSGQNLKSGDGLSRLLQDVSDLISYSSFEDDGLIYGVRKDADNASISEIYENDGPSIFLSYNINDSSVIRHDINMLSIKNHIISENIGNSSLCIVYVSENSIKSCMEDIKKAFSKDIPTMLVYLEDLKLKFGLSFKVRYKSKIESMDNCSIKRYLLDEYSYYDSLFNLIKEFNI